MWPPPRSSKLDGSEAPSNLRGTRTDPGLPPQGYRLTVTGDGVEIEHADDLGLRYAHDTLDQLRRAGDLRQGTVEDWPAMPVRTYMLDISRDRVPTRETLGWLIGILGRLRYTELQLYTEHTFAWPDHEIVWRDASPMTADDLRWIGAQCTSAGIELVPCLNGFGHMERFLRHDHYRHRAECPEGAPALGRDGLVPPTTLAPTPDNAAFAIDLFQQYLAASPAARIHIGGDEPFELGKGVSARDVAERGRPTVYLEHLRRLIDPFVDDHEVLFWADILRDAPEHVAALPDHDVTAVVWHYEAPNPNAPSLSALLGPEVVETLGMPDDGLRGFSAHTRTFAETGFPFRVAAGTSTWNSFIGRFDNARGNITDAVHTGVAEGARGFQLTDWGDAGHHHPLAISLPPLVFASGAAWSGDEPTDDARAIIDDLIGVPDIGARLVSLGEVHTRLGARSFNASPLCQVLFGSVQVRSDRFADEETVFDILSLLDDTAERCGDIDPIGPELSAICGLARVGVERLALAAGRPVRSAAEIDADLPRVVEAQRAAWLGSSRPGGLADSIGRIR